MKIKIITVLFFCSLIPLFAENQIRWDLGISGLMIPFSPDEDFYYTGDESWNIESDEIAQGYAGAGGPILPIGDIGLFGQFNFGKWRIGVGIRDISVLFIFNILYPLAYIEADAGPVTFNFQVGGGVIGAMSLFASFYLAGPYILPEASVWLRFSNKFRLGGGVLVGITPKIADDDIEKYLKNFTIGFLGFKYLIQKPWL
ncbi:MAG: hypothetical protein LBG05_06045 [Treponema sp.]|jgi:hypothetical protein|nr:hypothetical protein [Treponema sp.]